MVPVQVANSGAPVSGVITATLSGVTAGNLLLLAASYYSADNTTLPPGVPTDAAGTWNVGYVPNPVHPVISNDRAGVGFWLLWGAAAGSHSVALNCGTTPAAHSVLFELPITTVVNPTDSNGIVSSGSVSGTNSRNSGTTGTLSSASDFAVAAMVLCSGAGVANAGISTPTSFTQQFIQNNTTSDIGVEVAYWSLAANTAISANWTWTDASTLASMGGIICLNPSAAPPANTQLMVSRGSVKYGG